MSYTTTITFPVQNVSPTETIQLILEFTHALTGTNRSWTAAEKNLRVLSYGTRSMSYDLDDAFMVPGKNSFVIGDPDGVLDDLLFGAGTIAVATDKKAKVTKKINGVAKFIGNISERSVDSDDATKVVRFDAAPDTTLINKKMIFDLDGTTPLDPLSLGDLYLRYPISQLIEKAYQLVNPAINYADGSLEFVHDFKYMGIRYSGGGACWVDDFQTFEIELLARAMFVDNYGGLSTVGDVLRKIAIDLFAFTGMISYDKAFFKQLFHYNADNLQVVDVLSREKGYRYDSIDYVKFQCVFKDINGIEIFDPSSPYEAPSHDAFTELEDSYINRESFMTFFKDSGLDSGDGNVYTGRVDFGHFSGATDYFVFDHGSNLIPYPENGTIYSNNGSEFTVIGSPLWQASFLTTKRTSGTNDPNASGTLTWVSGSGNPTITYTSFDDGTGFYNIYRASHPNIQAGYFLDYGDLITQLWFKYRGNIQNCRVDKFILRGISYDFLKDFNYAGSKYQPISMIFQDSIGITECEAIYLGEL